MTERFSLVGRQEPSPAMMPTGLSVGATLAFLRAAYQLRGWSNSETVEVGPLLVDIEEEKKAAVALAVSKVECQTVSSVLDRYVASGAVNLGLIASARRFVERFSHVNTGSL